MASRDCVPMTATIEIENKTISGKIYIADSRDNLLGLDFIESLGLLDILFNSVCDAVFRSPAQSANTGQTDDNHQTFFPSLHRSPQTPHLN